MADDVQPADAGQGADTTDSGLYDLDSVAPEIREAVAPHLKAIEGNVTKKFQEAADYRKQWSPYEEIGLNNLQPDQVKGLLEFAEMANDPEQFGQWWETAGKEMGLFDKFTPDSSVEDLELEDDLSPEKVQELIEKQVAEKIGPIEQTLQQQQMQSKEAQANEEIASAMGSIRGENSSLFEGDEDGKVENRIARLAYSYSDDNSLSATEMIQKGFEDYKEMIEAGEKGLFQQKANQPKPPEGPGGADTSPEKVSSFSDPRLKQAAIERLRKSLSS